MKKFWSNKIQLKIAGTALLLFSFVTQETLKNFSNEKREEFNRIMINYSLADVSSQNFMNLYFTSASVTSVVNDSLIKLAAMEKVNGFLLFVTLSDTSDQKKMEIIDHLSKQARAVNNIEQYNVLAYHVKSIYDKFQTNIIGYQQFWKRLLIFSNKAYFVLYLLGSIFLIRGIKFE